MLAYVRRKFACRNAKNLEGLAGAVNILAAMEDRGANMKLVLNYVSQRERV